MKKDVIICGSAECVYAAALACLLTNFQLSISLYCTDELAAGRFQELASAADLQANVSMKRAEAADFKAADLLLITDLKAFSSDTKVESDIQANLTLFQHLIATAMGNGFAGKICSLQKYDALFVYFAWRFSGLPQNDILGFGTFPLTLLLERLLQKQLHVGAHDVRAYVIGTQNRPTIAWSRAYVGVAPILKLMASEEIAFDADKMTQLEKRVQTESQVTQFALQAVCLQTVLRALLFSGGLLAPFTALHTKEANQTLAYSMPVYLDHTGVRQVAPLVLSKTEQSEIEEIITATRGAIAKIEQGDLRA